MTNDKLKSSQGFSNVLSPIFSLDNKMSLAEWVNFDTLQVLVQDRDPQEAEAYCSGQDRPSQEPPPPHEDLILLGGGSDPHTLTPRGCQCVSANRNQDDIL